MSTGIVLPRKPRARPPVLKVSNQVCEEEKRNLIQISQVSPQVYMSGYEAAKNNALLASKSITHILNLAGESKCPNAYGSSFHYCSMKMPDNPKIDILFFLYFAMEFIIESVRAGGKVLIHCVKGTSRSAAVALAYLMLQGYSEQEAYTCLSTAHPTIDPNLSFVCQLREFINLKKESRVFYYSSKYDMFVNNGCKDGSNIVLDGNSCTLFLCMQDPQTQIQKAVDSIHLWEKFNSAQSTVVYM